LTKLVASDSWTVVCWRGLFSAPVIVIYAMWREKSRPLRAVFDLGWKGWTLATIGSLASAAFIASFKLTYVANVVVIYATVPFAAAMLGWLALRERVRASTLLAAGGAFVGVMIMVSGGAGTGHLVGDLLAALMTLGMAVYGTAETPLAPLLAWLILAELPPVVTFVGGGIVLAVILAHAAHDFVETSAKHTPGAAR
jgi:drug/metabolite transporter (DMT)-like permease